MASQVTWHKRRKSPNGEPQQHVTDYLKFVAMIQECAGADWRRKRARVSARAERMINELRR